jgi:hypothetical protein
MVFNTSGSEAVRIDSSRRLLVGTSSNFTRGNLQVVDGGAGEILIARNDTSVASGNDLAHIFFGANDGGTGYTVGNISVYADGAHSSTSHPSRIEFHTVASGSTSSTERMRLDSSGNLKFNSGYGSVATAYGCRAWVNFDGTGTVSIRGHGNISSVTDLGTGEYRINFANNMPDVLYAPVTGSSIQADSSTMTLYANRWGGSSAVPSNVGYIECSSRESTANQVKDINYGYLAIFR